MTANTIEAGLIALSSVDQDHASQKNGVGFNGTDTRFGNSLAQQLITGRDLSDKQRYAGYKLLKKYKIQLKTFDIDYDQIPQPDKPVAPNVPRKIDAENGLFYFSFPYDNGLKDALKESIPDRRWDADRKIWTVPLDASAAVAKFALTHSFYVTEDALDILHDQKLRQDVAVEETNENIQLSFALDAKLDIPGLKLTLHPFQKAGVKYALKNLRPGKGIYIGDEMGLGKTPQGLAILETKEAFPVLIVVPRVVWLKWAREIDKWLVKDHKVVLLAGRVVTKRTRKFAEDLDAKVVKLGETLPDADIYIVNYSVFHKWLKPSIRMVNKKKTFSATGLKKKWKAVIFDEAHYLKEPTSQRTKAATVFANVYKPEVRIALSGTPIPNRPKELMPMLNILGRMEDIAKSDWEYMIRYCAGHKGPFGWDFTGTSNGAELNRKMRSSFYIQHDKKDVLPDLPPIQWVPVYADMETPSIYDAVQDDLDEAKLKYARAIKSLEAALNKSEIDQEQINKLRDITKGLENKVGVLSNEARKIVGQQKLKFVIEWVQDFLDSTDDGVGGGEKLIITAIHRQINEAISTHFNAPIIYGKGNIDQRQIDEDRFQNDPKCRLMVLHPEAGGVGINLTAASNVAFAEFPYRPMEIDQTIGRAYGRLDNIHGMTAYMIQVPNTIEDHILAEIIDPKRLVQKEIVSGSKTIA